MPQNVEEWLGEEREGEGGLVTFNPIGEYYGGRNQWNERHSRGRAELPNGDLYLGCYYRGLRHGLGVYRYKKGNGARYGGDWNMGMKSGWGTMYWPDGSQYTGCWSQNKIHGWGVYVYPNGDEYEGWWYLGHKNGRGIYRTKKTGEKFVGNWILGQRQGKGMIIRKNHKFIGNWYNDCPIGPGVFIFPELNCEQHGFYTMLKLKPESVAKYKEEGYQVLDIPRDPPPKNPMDLEYETRIALANEATLMPEDEGVGSGFEGLLPEDMKMPVPPAKRKTNKTPDAKDPAGPGTDPNAAGDGKPVRIPLRKTPEQEFEEKLALRMCALIEAELKKEAEETMPVTPIWRVIQITRLTTQLVDESVPPPPIPETPRPPIEEPEEEEEGEEEEIVVCKENTDEEARSLVMAREHKVGEPYLGQGTCQLNLSNINWPDDCPPVLKCSEMSFNSLDDLKNIVQSVLDRPLEPLDLQKIVAQNLHIFKGKGMDVSERWKECLEDESECIKTGMKSGPQPTMTTVDEEVEEENAQENEVEQEEEEEEANEYQEMEGPSDVNEGNEDDFETRDKFRSGDSDMDADF